MLRLRRPRLVIDLALNLLFAVWVAYFLATGSLIPGPLLRDRHAPRVVAVSHEGEVDADSSPPHTPSDLSDES